MIIEHAASVTSLISDSLNLLSGDVSSPSRLDLYNEVYVLLKTVEVVPEIISLNIVIVNIVIAAASK
jgi:hypothetical protein